MILHLETSTHICSVALSHQGKLVAIEESHAEQYIHGEQLTRFIQKVLAAADLTPDQLTAVSVSKGPGSFTGLRIGMATAKGLAFGLNIPIIGISSLESLVAQGQLKHSDATFAAAFAARKSEVFLRIQSEKSLLLDDQSVDLEHFTFESNRPLVLLGNACHSLFDYFGSQHHILDETIVPSASGQISLAWKRFENDNIDDLITLSPNYTKPCFIAQKKS
jgi:tRNA threonylcarbamoyladenosine biosynthesis protein TsaB